MKNESLAEQAQRTLATFAEAEAAAEKYNDFGSIMGIQDETECIREELRRALGRAALRSRRLKLRINAWEGGERRVEKLRG
jgi:hypothetical protein